MGNCLSAPLDVFIAITYNCNLSCAHCNVYPTRDAGKELSTSQWVDFIRRLAEMKVFTLWISGGEPLLREDFFTLLDEIEKYHFHYGLNTNATLIDENISKELSRFKRLNHIVVSLDGSTAEIHERLRGKGSFDKTITGIRNLLLFHSHVSTYTTVNQYNYDDIENIVSLGKSLGVIAVKFNEMLPLGNALCHLPELAISNAQRRYLTRRLESLRAEFGNFVIGTVLEMSDFFKPFQALDEMENSQPSGTVNGLFGCGGGITKCTVRPDGYVVPCDRLWNFKAGNILTTDFQEIWKTSAIFAQMRQRARVSLDDIEHCRGCHYKSLCVGGCPAVAYELRGSVYEIDPLSCYKIYMGEGYPYDVRDFKSEYVHECAR